MSYIRSRQVGWIVLSLCLCLAIEPFPAASQNQQAVVEATRFSQITLEDIRTSETPGRYKIAVSLLLRSDGTATRLHHRYHGAERIALLSGTFPRDRFERLSQSINQNAGAFRPALQQFWIDSGKHGRFIAALPAGAPPKTLSMSYQADSPELTTAERNVEAAIREIEAGIEWQMEDMDRLSSGIRGVARYEENALATALTKYPQRWKLTFHIWLGFPGGGHVLKKQTLDGTGRFEWKLPPGTYLMNAHAGWTAHPVPPRADQQFQWVVVQPGAYTDVVVNYGSQRKEPQ